MLSVNYSILINNFYWHNTKCSPINTIRFTIVNITHGVWKAGSHDKVCYSGVSRDKYGASDRIRLQCLHLESALEIYKNPLLSEISEIPGVGNTCSIFCCGTSRKHAGVGIFGIFWRWNFWIFLNLVSILLVFLLISITFVTLTSEISVRASMAQGCVYIR